MINVVKFTQSMQTLTKSIDEVQQNLPSQIPSYMIYKGLDIKVESMVEQQLLELDDSNSGDFS